MQWKVHTARLLEEVLKNPGMSILQTPFRIFGILLASVAERAVALDDPELNILMLRLTLYEQGDPEKFSSEEIKAAYAEQRQRIAEGPKS